MRRFLATTFACLLLSPAAAQAGTMILDYHDPESSGMEWDFSFRPPHGWTAEDGRLQLSWKFSPPPGLTISYLHSFEIFSPDIVADEYPNPRIKSYSITGGSYSYLITSSSYPGPLADGAGPILPQVIFDPLTGDLQLDGTVDSADAGIMFSNWGGAGAGDLTTDGIVDAADAGALFANWTGDSGPMSVPEPHVWPMCGAGLAAIGILPRRSRPTCGSGTAARRWR